MFKIKLAAVVIIILVILNIFLPKREQQAVNMISDHTGIKNDKIQQGVDLATGVAKDASQLAKEKAIQSAKEIKNTVLKKNE